MSKGKTCGECKCYDMHGGCNKVKNTLWIHSTNIACIKFEAKNPTNGDRIISGGMRELAKAMVYGYRETDDAGQVTDGMLYTWHLPSAKAFTEYNEAVDYLENWLNAPADAPDTNVGTKESEGEDE